MNITCCFEHDEGEVCLTFIVDNVDGENEWSIDDNYIITQEDDGPQIPRTWKYLNEVYDPASLTQARYNAIDRAIDEYRPEDDHTLDDEGD
jgi:hypothetical protein